MKIEWTPIEVHNALSEYIEKNNSKEKLVAYITEKETKEIRTLAQNRTWYKLFWWISKHLWNHIQEIKIYFMIWCFWSKKLKLSKNYMEIPIISETHKLTKEQGILLIDTLLAFAKIKNIPIEITPLEIRNLYDSYNENESKMK